MTDDELDAIADRLWADMAGGDHYPAWLAGRLDLDAALAVQVRLLRKHEAAGEQLSGWKVGLTSPRARAMLGADVRPFGYLLTRTTLPSGASVAAADLHRGSIEPEFVFTVGARLAGADLPPEAVRAGIASVAAGYELNERRPGTARPDVVLMAADRMTQWGIVEGGGRPPAEIDPNEVVVRMRCNGEERLVATSRDELDDHWTSLARLAAELHRHGLALEAGQKVITGALGRFDVEAGQHWSTEFEGLGTVEVKVT